MHKALKPTNIADGLATMTRAKPRTTHAGASFDQRGCCLQRGNHVYVCACMWVCTTTVTSLPGIDDIDWVISDEGTIESDNPALPKPRRSYEGGVWHLSVARFVTRLTPHTTARLRKRHLRHQSSEHFDIRAEATPSTVTSPRSPAMAPLPEPRQAPPAPSPSPPAAS